MKRHCDEHRRYRAGCRACRAAEREHRAATIGFAPNYQPPHRTDADDRFVADLVADLTDAGLDREIRVAQLADWCADRLAEHAERPS